MQVGIGLALIDTDAGVEDGQHITVDVRGRAVECEVVRPPFVDVKTRVTPVRVAKTRSRADIQSAP